MDDKELERGLKLTYKNASRMIEEADGLKLFERYSRAYSLYQLAIEEVGKCILIFNAVLEFHNETKIDFDYFDSLGFKNHKPKTKKSIDIEIYAIKLFEKYIGKTTTLAEQTQLDYDKINESNDLKNQSLYVGIQDDKFIDPDSVIKIELVNEIELKAKMRLKIVEPFLGSLEAIKEIAIAYKDGFKN